MLRKLHHVGIVVRDLEATAQAYERALGLPLQRVEDYGNGLLRIGFIPIGETLLELLQPLTGEGSNAQWLREHGEGIQHLAFEVDDVEAALEQLKHRGVALLDEHPKSGASQTLIAFLDPAGMADALLELVQETPASRAMALGTQQSENAS